MSNIRYYQVGSDERDYDYLRTKYPIPDKTVRLMNKDLRLICLVTPMKNWKSVLNADPTEWLLEDSDPSVRYYTLTELLGKGRNTKIVTEANANIMKTGPVPSILSKQMKGGYWLKLEDFYMRTKYKGTVWSFIMLAELGADGNDEQIKSAADFLFNISQDIGSGGFSYDGTLKNGGHHSKVIPCLTSNMVWCMLRFGYGKDPRTKKGLNWLTGYHRVDDGEGDPPKEWPYKRYEQCWGKHTCSMCVIKAMKAISEIPQNKRTRAMKHVVETGAEYFLTHHIHKRSHDLTEVAKPIWLKFGFPLFWQTDALDIMLVLTGLGYKDERMEKAVELILSKQDEEGRWKLEHTFNDRTLVRIEKKGKPSKWITLNAMRVLKEYYS